MYTVNVSVLGTAPLLQHRFPIPPDVLNPKGGKKVTGSVDYSEEWREYLYADSERNVYQPSSHFEGALVKSAAQFKVTGKRGKSYKDLFNANVIVSPEKILHGIKVPETLDADGDKQLYLDVRPVIIQRARVIRLRPALKTGWKLDFEIQVNDDQLSSEILNDVLILAGKTVGVGDYRPKFGRFIVSRFDVVK
jgi:hypothetical protein